MLPTTDVRTIKLPSGEAVPARGQGTWHMGEDGRQHKQELEALRLGLDLGMCEKTARRSTFISRNKTLPSSTARFHRNIRAHLKCFEVIVN